MNTVLRSFPKTSPRVLSVTGTQVRLPWINKDIPITIDSKSFRSSSTRNQAQRPDSSDHTTVWKHLDSSPSSAPCVQTWQITEFEWVLAFPSLIWGTQHYFPYCAARRSNWDINCESTQWTLQGTKQVSYSQHEKDKQSKSWSGFGPFYRELQGISG